MLKEFALLYGVSPRVRCERYGERKRGSSRGRLPEPAREELPLV